MNATCRLLLFFLILWGTYAHAGETVITDLAGREVTVPDKVERILLGEDRFIHALAILERPDPLARVAAMLGQFRELDPVTYAQYQERFPHLAEVTRVGHTSAASFSVEQAIAAQPDIAFLGLIGHGPTVEDRATVARLERAGITVVFVDFRKDPLANTPRSIEVMGKVLGRTQEAEEYLDFYRSEMARVLDVIEARQPRSPTVFIESRVGFAEGCCETMVNGMLGQFVDRLGGRNLAQGLIPGTHGVVSLEFLLSEQPDVYIATAIGTNADGPRTPYIALGAGVDSERAYASLDRAMQRRGIAQLESVRAERAHAIWHTFYDSPFNVVAVQVFAQWLYPGLFPDLDPRATHEEIFARFQPVPLDGTYWISL
ncbi:iron ABC transporter substrate-binding protein [Alkalilimnicola ehrlichii]|uniref:Iron ABC transporter substrate-binding protein n=1 Tax=Alkalilimnicola ehrlichii TaxID=351052 RepID=A0A3E0WZW7_9GAMM|nr:ABC transporter substrate-binding protein [Alkalilimnicola ehrlichii]RFA29003.1 iron ABC transporter substrate-binding protein [Alkalilimnicola ehrlichii]RFA38639.1 iron ABC transporter substrate-binding protein [Alkalilimnicola ehrlichii]